MRPAFYKFEKIWKFGQNFKDAVVYGWGRQILKKFAKTKEAASADVNTNRFDRFMNSGIGGYFVNFALFQHGRTLPPGGGGGGVLGYILGGYVPPGSPNLDPVLERICTQNDTPF